MDRQSIQIDGTGETFEAILVEAEFLSFDFFSFEDFSFAERTCIIFILNTFEKKPVLPTLISYFLVIKWPKFVTLPLILEVSVMSCARPTFGQQVVQYTSLSNPTIALSLSCPRFFLQALQVKHFL